jgi:hypothetical protein
VVVDRHERERGGLEHGELLGVGAAVERVAQRLDDGSFDRPADAIAVPTAGVQQPSRGVGVGVGEPGQDERCGLQCAVRSLKGPGRSRRGGSAQR